MKNIKYIVLLFVLLFTKNLMGQMTMDAAKERLHKGRISIDRTISLADDTYTDLRNSIEDLKEKEIYLNVIVKSHDCGTEPLKWKTYNDGTSQSFITGFPEEKQEGDVWFLQDVRNNQAEEYNKLYLLYLYPAGGVLYRNTYDINNPTNNKWEANKSIEFDVFANKTLIEDNALGTYQHEMCQKVNKALSIIYAEHSTLTAGFKLAACPEVANVENKIFDNGFKAFFDADDHLITTQNADDLNAAFLPQKKKLKSDYCTNVFFFTKYALEKYYKSAQDIAPNIKNSEELIKKNLSAFNQSQLIFIFSPQKDKDGFILNKVEKVITDVESTLPTNKCHNLVRDFSPDNLSSFQTSVTNSYPLMSSGAQQSAVQDAFTNIFNTLDLNKEPILLNPAATGTTNACVRNTAALDIESSDPNNTIVYPTINSGSVDDIREIVRDPGAEDWSSSPITESQRNELKSQHNISMYGDAFKPAIMQEFKEVNEMFAKDNKTNKIVLCNGLKNYKKALKEFNDNKAAGGDNQATTLVVVYKDKNNKLTYGVKVDISSKNSVASSKKTTLNAMGKEKHFKDLSTICERAIANNLGKEKGKLTKSNSEPFSKTETKVPAGEVSLDNIFSNTPTASQSGSDNPWNCFVKAGTDPKQVKWGFNLMHFVWDTGKNLEIIEPWWKKDELKADLDLMGGIVGPVNAVINQADNTYTSVIGMLNMVESAITGDHATRKQLLYSLRYPHLAMLNTFRESLLTIKNTEDAEERYYHIGNMGTELLFLMLNPAQGGLKGFAANVTKDFGNMCTDLKTMSQATMIDPNKLGAIPPAFQKGLEIDAKKALDKLQAEFSSHVNEFFKDKNKDAEYQRIIHAKCTEVLAHLDDYNKKKLLGRPDALMNIITAMHPDNGERVNAFDHSVSDGGTPIKKIKNAPDAAVIANFIAKLPDPASNKKFYDNLASFTNNLPTLDPVKAKSFAEKLMGLADENDPITGKKRIEALTESFDANTDPAKKQEFKDKIANDPELINYWKDVSELDGPKNLTARRDIRFLETFKLTKNSTHIKKHTLKPDIENYSAPNGNKIKECKGMHNYNELSTTSPVAKNSTMNDVHGLPIYNEPTPSSLNISSSITNPVVLVYGSLDPPNPSPNEYFDAKVMIWGDAAVNSPANPANIVFEPAWKNKVGNGNVSTFFPKSWTEERIIQEIAFARANLTAADNSVGTNKWLGKTSDGKKLQMYIDLDGSLPSNVKDFNGIFPIR